MLLLVYRRHVLMLQCPNSLFFRLTDPGSMVTYRRNRAAVWICVAGLVMAGRACRGGVRWCSRPRSRECCTWMNDHWNGTQAECGGKRAFERICVGNPNAKASVLYSGGRVKYCVRPNDTGIPDTPSLYVRYPYSREDETRGRIGVTTHIRTVFIDSMTRESISRKKKTGVAAAQDRLGAARPMVISVVDELDALIDPMRC